MLTGNEKLLFEMVEHIQKALGECRDGNGYGGIPVMYREPIIKKIKEFKKENGIKTVKPFNTSIYDYQVGEEVLVKKLIPGIIVKIFKEGFFHMYLVETSDGRMLETAQTLEPKVILIEYEED